MSTLDEIKTPTSITLLEEELLIGVPNNNNFSNKDHIFLKELSKENFISFQSDKPLRKILDTLCSYAGFTPNIVFESDVPSIVRQLIIAGLGISFIPKISWNIPSDNSIKLIHVVDPPCKRHLNISLNANNYMSKYAKIFKDFAVDYYSSL